MSYEYKELIEQAWMQSAMIRDRDALKRSKTHNNFKEEMAKKTVIRYMWKYLPVSVEMQQAVSHDEGVGKNIKDITPDDDSYVDMPEIVAEYPQEEGVTDESN